MFDVENNFLFQNGGLLFVFCMYIKKVISKSLTGLGLLRDYFVFCSSLVFSMVYVQWSR